MIDANENIDEATAGKADEKTPIRDRDVELVGSTKKTVNTATLVWADGYTERSVVRSVVRSHRRQTVGGLFIALTAVAGGIVCHPLVTVLLGGG